MAVAAADLTLADLLRDRLEAVLRPGQSRDGAPLRADVVELEHHRIAEATIDARGHLENLLQEAYVAEAAPPQLARVHAHLVKAPPAGPPRRAPAMTVGAHHLARGDLLLDLLDRRFTQDQRGDLGGLGPHVVELEDDRIVLSAVDARMTLEPAKDVAVKAVAVTSGGEDPQPGIAFGAQSLAVRLEARLAPVLRSRSRAGERGKRQILPAPSAALRHEHTFADEPDGSVAPSRPSASARRRRRASRR